MMLPEHGVAERQDRARSTCCPGHHYPYLAIKALSAVICTNHLRTTCWALGLHVTVRLLVPYRQGTPTHKT
jgi:hypothetical protein